MAWGQPHRGTDMGPTVLRKAGLLNMLSNIGWKVEDLGDLDFSEEALQSDETSFSFEGNAKDVLKVAKGNEKLAQNVRDVLERGNFPLILGGDHSIGIGILAGLLSSTSTTSSTTTTTISQQQQQQQQPGVLWFDAHADINTPFTSSSGNMHGMPVGLAMMEESQHIPGFEWLSSVPKLDPELLVYVGLRDVDKDEKKIIRDKGIRVFTMHDIDRYGIGNVMDMALEHVTKGHNNTSRPLHVTYDVDVVDPAWAPATGTMVRGGLTYREAHYAAEAVAQTGLLASADLVELNPLLTNQEEAALTTDLALSIITSMMGKTII